MRAILVSRRRSSSGRSSSSCPTPKRSSSARSIASAFLLASARIFVPSSETCPSLTSPARSQSLSAVTVQQNPEHHSRRVRPFAARVLLGVNGFDLAEVERLDDLDQEVRQMVLRQPIGRRWREQERLGRIVRAEVVAHVFFRSLNAGAVQFALRDSRHRSRSGRRQRNAASPCQQTTAGISLARHRQRRRRATIACVQNGGPPPTSPLRLREVGDAPHR